MSLEPAVLAWARLRFVVGVRSEGSDPAAPVRVECQGHLVSTSRPGPGRLASLILAQVRSPVRSGSAVQEPVE